MTVVWFIILVVFFCGAVAVALPAVAKALLTLVLSVVEPFKEVARLYKSNQKKKAILMTVLLSWIFLVFPLLLWLLHLAID